MQRFYACFVAAMILLVTFFHQGPGYNASGRLLTVFGLVEHHTFAADEWKGASWDYAEIGGHIYSDKAPMTSLIVVPFFWLWRLPSHHPMSEYDKGVAEHLGIFFSGALPFAFVALLCVLRARKNGMGPYAAVALAMVAVFGTSMADYGACFFGHMLAAAFLLAAYVLAVEQERWFVFAGFLGGCAVLTEYPLVLTQALTVLYLLTGQERVSRTTRYCLGALPMAIAMLVYNRVITGSFLDFPYNHVGDMWATMRTSFGIRLPSGSAAWELTFGQYRGLACYCPALLVFVPWMWSSFDGPRRRRNLVLAIMGCYLLFISSYFKWDGGWAVGPRHLMPVVALGVYEGLGALTLRRKGFGWFALFSFWGILVSIAASATDPLPGEEHKAPVFEVFFHKVAEGDFTPHALLREWGLPNGAYLLVIWAVLFVAFAVALGTMMSRETLSELWPPLAGAPSTSASSLAPVAPQASRSWRRWLWTLLPSASLPVGLLLVGWRHEANAPPIWTSSSAFVQDNWRTKGSTEDRGPYQLFFHTAEQDNPWVILDYSQPRPMHEITVTNREDCCKDRAVPLIVEASLDQKTWTQVAEKKEVFDTWKGDFKEVSARYLRLRVPKKTAFHLERVDVQ